MEQVLTCPKCGTFIDVNHFVNTQVEHKIQEKINILNIDFEKKKAEQIYKFELEQQRIELEKQNLVKEKVILQQKIDNEINQRLSQEKILIEKEIKLKIEQDKTYEINKLREELEEKNIKLKENINLKLELDRIKYEKDTLQQTISLEKEQEMAVKLKRAVEQIAEEKDNQYNLRIKEFEKKLEEQTKLADEMKRKAEQGSMQLQGEIQELELEYIIRSNFPYDRIEEVKKGQRGADLIHRVVNDFYEECGVIYYESKRTKTFSNDWIRKLKEDNQEQKADILVIASESLPNGKSKYYYEEGVWICNFNEIKPLMMVLRQSLIEINKYKAVQQGRETKKDLLYNYLTSNEFHNQLETIIIGFQRLQKSYLDEKARMQKIWKEREKQFDNILSNTIGFYGSLRGIAGQSIQSIPLLEDSDDTLLLND